MSQHKGFKENLTSGRFKKYNKNSGVKMDKKTNVKMPKMQILYELSDFFKVVGDSTRIQLLYALDTNKMCVSELAEILSMTTSAVSHQLKVLRTAKLVKSTKQGKNVYYELNDHHVKLILDMALEHVVE